MQHVLPTLALNDVIRFSKIQISCRYSCQGWSLHPHKSLKASYEMKIKISTN